MLHIKTFTGENFQTIHINDTDTVYNDLLKYITIPSHPRFENYNKKRKCMSSLRHPYHKILS